MISSDPAIRRWRSSESREGTMWSWSPLAMSVGCVMTDRSDGAESGDYEVLADDTSVQLKAALSAPLEALYPQLVRSAE